MFIFTLQQNRSSRTKNTARAAATTALYFLAHDVLVLRELTQFENKRFGRFPGFASFLNVTAKYSLQPGLNVALWIVGNHYSQRLYAQKTQVGQSCAGRGKVRAGVSQTRWRPVRIPLAAPPNSLSLDHVSGPPLVCLPFRWKFLQITLICKLHA